MLHRQYLFQYYYNQIVLYLSFIRSHSIRFGFPPHHIKLICNKQMGHCHCCPLMNKRRKSEDTLSIDTYHPSIAIEMPNRNIKRAVKKSQKRMNGTIKKQPIQIKQKHPRIPTLIDQIDPKIVPLLTPKNMGHLPLENDTPHLDRLKRSIKPQIQKISTMDDDESNSRSHSFHNQQSEQQSEQQSFNEDEPKAKKNPNNLTFTANYQHIVVSRQFRTNKDKAHLEQQTRESQLVRLQEDLKKQNLPIDTKCEIYYKLAKHQCELNHFDECNKYLSTAILKLKEIQSEELKFAIISLHGYVLLIEKEYAKSIPFLLKAVRMEVTRQGGETVKLVELYYWLGEAYLNQGNTKFSKEYLGKALRFYNQFQMQDSQLLKALYLNLGILLHKQGELAEADKFYTKAIKISEETTIGTKYFQLLLKKAENYFSMQNHKLSLWAYASTFKALRKYNLTQLQIHEQAKASLIEVLKKIESICISESELQSVIKSAQECIHDLPQVKILKARLKKMREILYK